MKAYIDMLVEEKIGSSTQVKQDKLKVVIEQFARQIETVQKDLDEQVKDKKANTVEIFKATRL